MWVQPNTSVVRAIARGQWQAPLGSSRGRPPDHGQPAAVLASVKDKPSAARVEQKNGVNNARQKWRNAPLTKKAPYKPAAVLASVKDKPSAARVEQKNGVNNARQKWRDAPLTKKACPKGGRSVMSVPTAILPDRYE